MFWLLDQLLGDPDRIQTEERERAVARRPRPDADGDPPELECRVCAYRGPERYCPDCLADTMRPPAQRR
ncbi:MAG: hypothetical protein F9K40_14455 [Kofleriaceae bacterium]|nr:MAG: hypothetical protein F9K40_14455 [Kofleriaceae bacterium]MBZ0233785.1 hypothetical protein [Kofleriaceae bacterium]